MISVPITAVKVESVDSLYSIAVVTPVILPSLLAAEVGAAPVNPIGAA